MINFNDDASLGNAEYEIAVTVTYGGGYSGPTTTTVPTSTTTTTTATITMTSTPQSKFAFPNPPKGWKVAAESYAYEATGLRIAFGRVLAARRIAALV